MATARRVTKDPEERKNELIDTAERLFLEQGYENTTVSDIVKEVKVAQGTFYYYFASKQDILDAVIEREIDEPEKEIMRIACGEGDAVAKLKEMADVILHFQTSKRGLIEHVHEESNAIMHEKMERRIIARLAPTIAEVVKDGASVGLLAADYPEETAEFMIAATIFLFHQPDIDEDRQERLHAALEKIIIRIFGFK